MRNGPSVLGRPAAVAVLSMLLGGYAWWAMALQPFTGLALVATLGGGLLLIIAASRFRVPRTYPEARAGGAVVWAGLALLLGVWELAAFLQRPRADHPTLSYLANMVLRDQRMRALAFLMWMMVAMDLARR